MRNSPYYSVRTGKNPLAARFSLPTLLELFKPLFSYFENEGYFQEALGYYCVDADFMHRNSSTDIEDALLLELRKKNLTPIDRKIDQYSEDDLFDIIEFLYDHCSKPIERHFHNYSNCGWHCTGFDRQLGRQEFYEKINKVLPLYENGFELSSDGEILSKIDSGLETLFEAPLPSFDPDNIETRIEAAVRKFRRYKSSMDERRDAIRDLADVVEYLRPKLKNVFDRKDEADLFNIANNFGIRHHNVDQKTAYDKPIWFSWMFYYYLATIHAAIRFIKKDEEEKKQNKLI